MEHWQLVQRQSLSLEAKIILTEQRIREWIERRSFHDDGTRTCNQAKKL
jgi:hypothetical protein